VEQACRKTIPVGRAFGVVIALPESPTAGTEGVEVASFRSDDAYVDGRRPSSVRPADEATDVQRRDFTINALIADPLVGELRDHVGGLADLDQRRLRVVGDPRARLEEDRLRVLRAWRFAARLGLSIDGASADALHAIVPDGLSRERVWDEWEKALKPGGDRRAWLRLLSDFDGVRHLIPLLRRLPADLFDGLDDDTPWTLPLALMLVEADADALKQWLDGEPLARHLRRDIDLLGQCCREGLPTETWRLRQWIRGPVGGILPAFAAIRAPSRFDEVNGLAIDEAGAGPLPPLLRGADLIALGVPPGPAMGQVQRVLQQQQLARQVERVDQAQDAVRRMVEEGLTGR
jgi:poly(A) polymerase